MTADNLTRVRMIEHKISLMLSLIHETGGLIEDVIRGEDVDGELICRADAADEMLARVLPTIRAAFSTLEPSFEAAKERTAEAAAA